MRVKISKWGYSTVLRIPQTFVDRLNLKPGEEVDITLRDNVVEIKRPGDPPTLAELYHLAETQQVPDTLDWGPDRGLEILPLEESLEISGSAAQLNPDQHAA